MRTLFILLLFGPLLGYAQAPTPSQAIQDLAPLLEGTWEVDTTFANGTRFHQRKVFYGGLSGHLIHTQTKGTVNEATQAFGLRNEGLIAYRAADSALVSVEVDVFGGVTESLVSVQNHNIYFDYIYQGQRFRDAWVYVRADEYRYEIRAWKEGGYNTLYLQAPMVRRDAEVFEAEYR